MKLIAGLWCPDVMSGPAAYLRRSRSLDDQIALARDFRTCVQAGGHIGIYPAKLAARFAAVHTFEPEPENFRCLARNTATLGNVVSRNCFLGADSRHRELRRHSKSSGGHQTGDVVSRGTPTVSIDELRLDDVDAVFLDVEGFEGEILKGARKTIERCRPLLVLEENRQGRKYGNAIGDLEAMMRPLGYRLAAREGEDIVLRRT